MTSPDVPTPDRRPDGGRARYGPHVPQADPSVPGPPPGAAGSAPFETGRPAEKHVKPSAGTPARRGSHADPDAMSTVGHKANRSIGVIVVAAVILALLLVFILQNLSSVTVRILLWQIDVPLGVALLVVAGGGALIAALIGRVVLWRWRRSIKAGE